jgi:alkanesulfonate monooxygenase SsuD/methylene tetrahydromethanopterin reductase-like flavin-dependent oxidoreductase (luciferase family)
VTEIKLGVVFLPQLPPERLRDVARAADDAGLDELWLWEDCFRESGIAAASAALAWTHRLRVGVGLLPVPLRNVALTAMELATMCRLFPGRFDVGIGHGVQDWMAQVGARVDSPMTLLREYTSALQALIHGQHVTVDGRYVHLDKVALDWPPAQPPRLFIGAIGPRSLALSGELADGTILTGGTTPDQVREMRAVIDQARAAAERPGRQRVVVYLVAATGPDARERLAGELRKWSLDPAQEVGVAGDVEAVAAAVRRWADAGADAVVLQPTEDEPDLAGFIRVVAGQVTPLVR